MDIIAFIWVWLLVGAVLYILAYFVTDFEIPKNSLEIVLGILICPLGIVFLPLIMIKIIFDLKDK